MRKFIAAIATIFLCLTSLAVADQIQDILDAWKQSDFARALMLVRPLAQSGNPTAESILGAMYSQGDGVTKDMAEAVKWWKRAAESGEPVAQENLADSYAAGRGIKEDWSEAVKWWRKAAEKHMSKAQLALGMALYEGRGTQQNQTEAAQWLMKAADQDQAQAQAMLAQMYALGQGGLTLSLVEAYKWILIAGDVANEVAPKTKIMVETMLRKTDKIEAAKLADQWKLQKGKIKELPRTAQNDNDVAARYFINMRQLSEKCSSRGSNDRSWCEAYIAGVVDTLTSGRKNLAEDAKEVMLCLQHLVSLREARESVSKVLDQFNEDKNPIILNAPAANSVIAGITVHLCK